MFWDGHISMRNLALPPKSIDWIHVSEIVLFLLPKIQSHIFL